MKAKINILLFSLFGLLFSCCKDDTKNDIIPETDISEEIVGEWVYDNPEENAWQSMKFVAKGSFFCYSDNKSNWTESLRNINKGSYGVKGMVISASTGSTYLDMTVSKINGYQFTGRLNETTVFFTFNKVVMRTHLNFGESILPPYEDLVDAKIISYKSHDESIAVIDEATGEITAIANNGRTYVDIVTESGTAVVKVMLGKINDGDKDEISPIGKKEVEIPNDPTINLSKAIIGKWIWDDSYWDEINFLENGKVYYSNIDVARGIYNENAPGDYTIDASTKRITLKVLPTGGTQMTVIMAMTAINKFSFTAKFYLTNGQSTGSFTYAKQIDSIELGDGEIRQPDYQTLVDSETTIKSFKTHNSNIVEVNAETGELTAKMGGKTYVDIVTDEGTAVVEVFVKKFFEFNYEEFIGVNKQVVTNTFEYLYTTDGDYIHYNYQKGATADREGKVKDSHWDNISFLFDSKTGLVKAISLVARKDVWFTADEMTEFLTKKYHYYKKESSDDLKAFMNAETLDEATVGITWDTTKGILTFVEIPHASETSVLDYGVYLGKSRDDIKSAMKGYSVLKETDDRIGYTIGSEYLRMVRFSFKSGSNITDKVQEVVVYLNTDIDRDFVKSEIEKYYKFSDGVEDSFLNYYSDDKKIRVVYQITSNLIQYIKR